MTLARISACRSHTASAPSLVSNAGEVRNRNKFWNSVYRSRHSSGSVTSKYASEVLIVSRVSFEAGIPPGSDHFLDGQSAKPGFASVYGDRLGCSIQVLLELRLPRDPEGRRPANAFGEQTSNRFVYNGAPGQQTVDNGGVAAHAFREYSRGHLTPAQKG
jgi:hypothetical protein